MRALIDDLVLTVIGAVVVWRAKKVLKPRPQSGANYADNVEPSEVPAFQSTWKFKTVQKEACPVCRGPVDRDGEDGRGPWVCLDGCGLIIRPVMADFLVKSCEPERTSEPVAIVSECPF